jgi:hypothetical protein
MACGTGNDRAAAEAARTGGDRAQHISCSVSRGRAGKSRPARAEQFAARIRLDLHEPQAARRLYGLAREVRDAPGLRLLFDRVLDGALKLSAADRGNVQIVDPVTGSLRIVAQHGFSAEFLDYFAAVDDERSACGRASTATRSNGDPRCPH